MSSDVERGSAEQRLLFSLSSCFHKHNFGFYSQEMIPLAQKVPFFFVQRTIPALPPSTAAF